MGVQMQEGALSDYISVPYGNVLKCGGLSYEEMALIEPLSVGAHLVTRANISAGEYVLVFGCGVIGSGAISAAGGADSTVYLFLSYMPPQLAVAGLFLIACFVSLSMGTSTGTISALAPFAVSMSQATGFDIVLCIAAVASGGHVRRQPVDDFRHHDCGGAHAGL